jgi:hemerythrin-like metal-binding protein
MWKEKYKIGHEIIDMQHKELCDTAEKLFRIVLSDNAAERKKECIHAISFLKDYASTHFALEEEYQLSINYIDIEAHKALHRDFVKTVQRLEQKLIAADFSIPSVKEVAGFQTTWWIYHIVGVDQKLKKREQLSDDKVEIINSYVDCFAKSANKVLGAIIGSPAKNVTFDTYSGSKNDIKILIGLVGGYKGEVVFTFTNEVVFSLIKVMTSIELTEIDELAYSALSEITNIISGNASSLISAGGKVSDITTPQIITDFTETDNRSGFYVDTELGRIAISVNVV